MDEELKKILENHEDRLNKLESSGNPTVQNEEPSEDVFAVENEKVIVTRFVGSSVLEKTQNISLLALLGYKSKLGKEKVLANEIRENVATNGIPLENFGTHIKKLIPQSILKFGKAGKTSYKLTTFGDAKAKKLLLEVLENDS